MNLNVESLRTFSRLAHTGAERAAHSLSQLVGLDTQVAVTTVELGSHDDVRNELDCEDGLVGVTMQLSGGLDGSVALAFNRESADQLVEGILPGHDAASDDELVVSGIEEVGNIMLGGFVDGWADYLGTGVELSTPAFVDHREDVMRVVPEDGERILVFRNQLKAASDAVNFSLFMVPTTESVGTIASAATGEETLPLEAFSSFGEMIADGAGTASENVTALTGIPTEVEVSGLRFVPVEGVPRQVPDRSRTGVVLEFDGLPSGYIAVLFDEESANNVAGELLPGDMAVDGMGAEMRQSAIQEIGNIVTSGFVDGWADALETKIEISPPTFVHDLGPAIVDPLVSDLAQTQEYAFLIDSTIRTPDDEFTCDIYALPDEHQLREALDQIARSPA
jgi:chemotaxis protein CheC